jgi:hypothetical protein
MEVFPITPPYAQNIRRRRTVGETPIFAEPEKMRFLDLKSEKIKKEWKKLERREELMKLVNETNAAVLTPLIEELLFIEGQLDALRKLPMIRINPDNPEQQKATPAAKMYKEFIQQYTNITKVISHISGSETQTEDSPLRAWVKSQNVAVD